jgi:hypothetical protein
MSAFNTVVVPVGEVCPRCGDTIVRRVQFKYGDRRAYEYAVGDVLKWGGNDTGVRAHLVQVRGYPEPCANCDYDPDGVYDVLIRDDVIESVTPGSGATYAGNDDGYVILEP